MSNWFEVDKAGLGKLLEKRGKAFALFELIQNAWDENTKRVNVRLEPVPGVRGFVEVYVEDDNPEGFKDLSHAFTLFAESTKKGDPEKRGRFNLGEKLVLALCERATITSTKGQVVFDKQGRRTTRQKRPAGTEFYGYMHMTRPELEEVLRQLRTIITPMGIETFVNGEQLNIPSPVQMGIKATLPTDVADEEGFLRKRVRETTIDLWMPRSWETGWLYEMGIPVVETGDKYHVNIQQKVPLNMDRDNVTPAYLQQVRTAVLNATFDLLKSEDANAPWVRNAVADKSAEAEATLKVMSLRFGDKRVIFDPSDPEANKLAVSKGYTVIHGGMLSGGEWENVKSAGAALPAGQVTPSPKPYSPDGQELNVIEEKDWTPGMRLIAEYAQDLGQELLGMRPSVLIANNITWPVGATFGPSGQLTLNLGRLGHKWFDSGIIPEVNQLLIHEFGHFYSLDHLSSEYHEALCELGARLTALALANPEFFRR
jgi:hypothetical protein